MTGTATNFRGLHNVRGSTARSESRTYRHQRVLYSHGSSPFPRTATGHPDLDEIAKRHPGQLIHVLSDVPRGGNDVLSFLDVAAPDAIALPELTSHLDHVEAAVSAVNLPKTWYVQAAEITVMFSARNLSGAPAGQEYAALKRRLVHLLTGDRTMAANDPLDAELVRRSDAYELSWTPPTRDRLAAAGFHPAARLSIAYDVADQFAEAGLPGPLVAHSIAAMAGADLHELVRLGGVRVFLDGKTFWQRLPP